MIMMKVTNVGRAMVAVVTAVRIEKKISFTSRLKNLKVLTDSSTIQKRKLKLSLQG
jgi:hypothetical protein